MKPSAILKLIIVVVTIPLCLGLLVRFLYKDVQEVCVPVHIRLDTTKYKVLRVDMVETTEDFPVKKIYYIERKKK